MITDREISDLKSSFTIYQNQFISEYNFLTLSHERIKTIVRQCGKFHCQENP